MWKPGRSGLVALGLMALFSPVASAQVAFQPNVSAFPNGVGLSATPVVSADRRYVRLGMNPQFTGLEGFDTYSVPAAVGGGGLGLGGGIPNLNGGNLGLNGQAAQGRGFGNAGGYGYQVDPDSSAFLAGGANYPQQPRLSAGLAPVVIPKPKIKVKKGRTVRARRP